MVSKCYDSNHSLQKKSWSIMWSFHLTSLFSSSIFLNEFQGKLVRGAKKTKRNKERSCPYWKITNISSRRWGGTEIRMERSFSKKEDSSWELLLSSAREKRRHKEGFNWMLATKRQQNIEIKGCQDIKKDLQETKNNKL